MNHILTPAEEAVLCVWKDYIRTHSDFTIRRSFLFYLMVETLIAYYTSLPDDQRPQRPSEAAINDMDTTSGALSKWRKKWQKIWFELQ